MNVQAIPRIPFCAVGCGLLLAAPVAAQYRSAPAYPLAAPPLEILDKLATAGLGD